MQKITQYFKQLRYVQKIILGGWLVLMLLLPFHAFISTWGGSAIGPYSLWKVWKEVLLLALCIPTFILIFSDQKILHTVKSSWLLRLMGLYVVLHVLATLVLGRDPDAVLYGLAINLRIVLFFFVSFVLFSSLNLSKKVLVAVVMAPCVVVVVFGLLQLFVLPVNFLSHFGYEKGVTIAPSLNIDEQPDEIRIMSTLRGPNPLGAYLIFPLTILVCYAPLLYKKIRKKAPHQYQFAIGVPLLFTALLVTLYGTHGRAAWIGAALSLAVALFYLLGKKMRMYAVAAGFALLVILGVSMYQLRHTPFVQTVILHDNPETGAEVTSNDAHVEAAKDGLADVADKPILGCGPGCAGPASFYSKDGINLAENYYIQVAQEVGVLGLVLFLSFILLVALQLYAHKNDRLALALLASLVGISVANLFLHVWADDTLAYVWWGTAGALLATYSHQGSKTAISKHPRTSA